MESKTKCTRCILPTSLPSVNLDNEGVCSQCRNFDHQSIEWAKVKKERQRQFEKLVQRVKHLKRPYDCLIPLSGGKDSTYALYYSSIVHGLKCLCVTFDNGFLSEHARSNIERAITVAGADHVYYRLNRKSMLKLYRVFIEKCGNFCQACMRGIEASIDFALRGYDIPMVVAGNGTRISYDALPEVFQAGDFDFFRNVVEGEEIECEVRGLLRPNPRQDSARALYKYRLVRGLIFKALRIPIYGPVPLVVAYIPLYDWIDINHDERAEALKIMGWESPSGVFEHMDCKVHDMIGYIQSMKFPELSMKTFYRSGQVREGVITRDEALKAEDEDLSMRGEPDVLNFFLEEIKMSRQELESCTRDWRRMEQFRHKSRRGI